VKPGVVAGNFFPDGTSYLKSGFGYPRQVAFGGTLLPYREVL
jgi:hypothetical protein